MRPRRRWAVAALALAVLAAAAAGIDLDVTGAWSGLFLLRGTGARPLVLKDDLLLGDGPRLLLPLSFSPVRRLLTGGPPAPRRVMLELEWNAATGAGLVRNHLADDTDLVTFFSRYSDSEGNVPRGLFVGGALPDVAASADQNESGMTFRDDRGWHHIWCNVNEMLEDETGARSYPGQWRFLGSRALLADPQRVVLESHHELPLRGGPLRMSRFAYFRAGEPWFRLGIQLVNVGEREVRFTYAYGDEPWVGTFGTADGNVGWVRDGLVTVEGPFDPRANRWAGILDRKSGLANFLAWTGEVLPDLAFFANQPGPRVAQYGRPLTSNEVFIGLQWRQLRLAPGESASILLAVGLADTRGPAPRLPAGAPPERR